MDKDNYKYIPNYINKKLKYTTSKKDVVVGNEDLRVLFPRRFTNVGLAHMGSTVEVIGSFIICDLKGNYSKFNIPAVIAFEPNLVDVLIIDDVEFIELTFTKGSPLITTNRIMKISGYGKLIFKELIEKGNIPFYSNYSDMLKLYNGLREFADSNLSDNVLSGGLFIGTIARLKNGKYYRTLNRSDMEKQDPIFIGLANVPEGLSTTIGKITGSYLSDAISSELFEENNKPITTLEKTLRE